LLCNSTINKYKHQPFFEANPDAMNAFKKFWIENLKSLLVEKMYDYENDYLHDHLVPTLVSNSSLEINGLEDELIDNKECPACRKSSNWQ
jgi:hypothetical protein